MTQISNEEYCAINFSIQTDNLSFYINYIMRYLHLNLDNKAWKFIKNRCIGFCEVGDGIKLYTLNSLERVVKFKELLHIMYIDMELNNWSFYVAVEDLKDDIQHEYDMTGNISILAFI